MAKKPVLSRRWSVNKLGLIRKDEKGNGYLVKGFKTDPQDIKAINKKLDEMRKDSGNVNLN